MEEQGGFQLRTDTGGGGRGARTEQQTQYSPISLNYMRNNARQMVRDAN